MSKLLQFFFFSSRRRHTRSLRDWSSDVCSSDLRCLDDLERELRHLGARGIVVQAYLRGEDIRNDGWPRSSARFMEPGIVLSFTDRSGQALSFQIGRASCRV